MKKLLVLGGTRISCEIIKKAKNMGVYVIVTDYNSVKESPGKQIADESFMISCTDVNAVVNLIKKEHISGVITGFTDILLPYYAEICEKAGLPSYGTKEQFDVFIKKHKYKALMKKYGVPTVEEYYIGQKISDTDIKNIEFPVLVKPVDNSGARGISICNNESELKKAYAIGLSYSKSKKILVERYLSGKEVTIFWLFIDGQYYLSGIGNRHVKYNQEGVIPLPVGYTFPAKITKSYIRSIEEKTKGMFRSVGIKNGMMFMQAKIEGTSCIVYDIGYRLTGSLEYKLFKEVNGYDPLEMMIHFALTGKMKLEKNLFQVDPMFRGVYPYNVSCLARPGKIKRIDGIKEVKELPGVIDVVVSHYPGEEITSLMKGLLTQIVVRVLGVADNKEDAILTMKKIENMICIISDTDDKLNLPGIEDSDMDDII